MESYEVKTPSQVLHLLKEDLNIHKGFLKLLKDGFIEQDRFYKTSYELIQDNFKVTGRAFILNEQVDILIKNEVQLCMDEALTNLLDSGYIQISHINNEGKLLYGLTELGHQVHEIITKEHAQKDGKI